MVSTAAERCSDPEQLLPSFRRRVVALLARLRAAELHPVLFETFRTPERAAQLARRGTGIVGSMHCYGVAADIICELHLWACHEHGCKFFDALLEQGQRLGLTCGGEWARRDLPHVQGIPLRQQAAIRAANTAEERDAIAAKWLDMRPM